MATINSFEDLKSWQEARILCQLVFLNFSKDHRVRDFELVNQINRSSVSVMNNIAVGFERDGNKEFISIAKASCDEMKSQLYRAFDREYLTDVEFEKMRTKTEETSKLIAGMMSHLQNTNLKGIKFS